MGMRGHRVGEKEHGLQLTMGDHGPQLLITAKRAAFKRMNIKCRKPFLQYTPGGAGGKDAGIGKTRLMLGQPVGHFTFATVMGNNADG